MSNIEFDSIGREFKRDGKTIPIIAGFDLTVKDREFVAIVGPSGCGKTTCMRMAAGLDFPSSGVLKVAGKSVVKPGPERAVVFQQFALFPWKSVYDNIDFGLRAKNLPKAKRHEIITHYIGLMNLNGYESAYPHQLSGGMQQRVAIARAYALDPDVLLMDEPFGALDAQTRVVMQEELVKLARKNPRTVLFITHAVEEAVYLADRVVIMAARPGRVKEILDIKTVREAEHWDAHPRIEDVMDLESFVHLRTRIWKSLREEHAGVDH
jgi:NitT/TauT family transport system ATP-binding protein